MPGADGAYSNIEEAVSKLKGVVGWRKRPIVETEEKAVKRGKENNNRRRRDFEEEDENPIVTTRLEPELKTHTSYLLFATLPPPWSAADEETARLRVEAEKAKYIMERDSNEASMWKKEKATKKGRYGPPPGVEGDGSETKGLTRKERKKLERAERYRKDREEQEEGQQGGDVAAGDGGGSRDSEMMEIP